jgi:hypothetical protein
MGRFVKKTTGNLFKMLLTLGGLALVFYILIEFRLWSTDWTDYFMKHGRFEEIIFVSLIVAGISMVVLKLFSWHLRAQMR